MGRVMGWFLKPEDTEHLPAAMDVIEENRKRFVVRIDLTSAWQWSEEELAAWRGSQTKSQIDEFFVRYLEEAANLEMAEFKKALLLHHKNPSCPECDTSMEMAFVTAPYHERNGRRWAGRICPNVPCGQIERYREGEWF